MQSVASSPLDRFSALFMPYVDREKYKVDLLLDGDIIRLHLREKLLDGENEAGSIGKFYATYRDEMLEAIVRAGEEIQLFQISCCDRAFKAHNARDLIRALQMRDRVGRLLGSDTN